MKEVRKISAYQTGNQNQMCYKHPRNQAHKELESEGHNIEQYLLTSQ